ncbi:hypothetical protein BAE44_0022090 [Dichanthelium oligosanthes]|uniref:WIYLD domain-containing protein n=1 Tax=Dichanthelium oligosanthes TaxID=888268 RepID=A0A1E5UVI6_9POAL|nr:hypothetical protein BAE44_0022090 [Dichanthelium oligosanthes]
MARPRTGERRIDAAIDHLAQYGFPKLQIRILTSSVHDASMIQLYGRDGWVFLEEGSYRVVLEKLLEEQAQLEKQEASAADEASPKNDMEVSPPVLSEALTESQPALEPQASHNSSPPLEHVLPPPPATGAARARLPCYGWISEESETDSELEDGEMLSDVPRPAISPKKDIPDPVETLPSKRKRPSRWDVRPNW